MLKMVDEYRMGVTFTLDSPIIDKSMLSEPAIIDVINEKSKRLREIWGIELGRKIADSKPWVIRSEPGGGVSNTLNVIVLTNDELKEIVRAHNGEIY